MNIKFRCTKCGKQLSAPPSAAGQRRKCPNCGTKVVVPKTSPAATEHTEPATDNPLLLFPPRGDDYGNLIDMTAMVDIVFFLLIFFLVTSMQALEAVINLPTPQASEGAASQVQAVPDYANDPEYVVVTIDADNAVYVEDDEAMSEQDLRAKLRAALREDGREGMLIKGAGDATHGKFVMVLDAGADAGVKELLFSVDQSDEASDGG
jgi:biopolymer transport protein ExbD